VLAAFGERRAMSIPWPNSEVPAGLLANERRDVRSATSGICTHEAVSAAHTHTLPHPSLRPSSPRQLQGLGARTVSLPVRPSSPPPPRFTIHRQLSIALKDDRRLRVPIFRTQPSESAVAKDALGHRLLLQEAATKSHCSDNVLPPSSNGSLPGLARLPNILLLCSSSGCIAARLAVL
jgi:hypothetical protein